MSRRREETGYSIRADGTMSARDLPCLCGCKGKTIDRDAKFIPGHDAKLKSRIKNADSVPNEAYEFFRNGEKLAGLSYPNALGTCIKQYLDGKLRLEFEGHWIEFTPRETPHDPDQFDWATSVDENTPPTVRGIIEGAEAVFSAMYNFGWDFTDEDVRDMVDQAFMFLHSALMDAVAVETP